MECLPLAACHKLDIALVAILPLAEGVLPGKYRVGGREYPSIVKMILRTHEADIFHQKGETSAFLHAIKDVPYALQREHIEPLFVLLEKIASDAGASVTQVALNWLLKSSPHIIPIPGAKVQGQAIENAGTLKWTLSQEQFEEISSFEQKLRAGLGL